MFCRRAWQRLAPLARRVFKPASMNDGGEKQRLQDMQSSLHDSFCSPAAPLVRRMAFGIPGGSTNVAYFVLCGGGLTAAVVYAYKTVSDDSERYEERLSSMGTKTALSSEAVPEASAPAAEPTSEESAPAAEPTSEESAPAAEPTSEESAPAAEPTSEESAPAAEPTSEESASAEEPTSEESAPAAEPAPAEEETEVAPSVVESVPSISEPVAEISADPVTEAPSEEVVVSEVVMEEAASPVEKEVALDASAAAEMSEAPAAESTDLFSAVKFLASSTPEIAAASVGEESPVKAVHQSEVDRIGLNAEVETFLVAVGESDPQEASEEEPNSANELDLKPAKDEKDASAEDEEAVTEEKLATAATTEDKEASSEEMYPIEKLHAENPEDAAENILPSKEASPEDAASSEEASPADITEDPTLGEQKMSEEITSTEAAGGTAQLAAASTEPDLEAVLTPEPELMAEAPLHEAACCPTCHSAPSAGEEELRPPADAPAEELVPKVEVNTTLEAKEKSSSLVEEQTINSLAVLTAAL